MGAKRRACLAVESIVKAWAAEGARTLTPERVLAAVASVSEHAMPEAACDPRALRLFHKGCTLAELAWLLEQYERASFVDLAASAKREIGQVGRMADGAVGAGL